MNINDTHLRSLARALYVARMRAAWGSHWETRDRWPADDEAWRAYPHNPIAEVDLCFAQAEAALEWWVGQ